MILKELKDALSVFDRRPVSRWPLTGERTAPTWNMTIKPIHRRYKPSMGWTRRWK